LLLHMAFIDNRAVRSDQLGSIVHEAMHHAGMKGSQAMEDKAEAAVDCMQEATFEDEEEDDSNNNESNSSNNNNDNNGGGPGTLT